MVVSAAAELPVQSVTVMASIFISLIGGIIALLQIGAAHEQRLSVSECLFCSESENKKRI